MLKGWWGQRSNEVQNVTSGLKNYGLFRVAGFLIYFFKKKVCFQGSNEVKGHDVKVHGFKGQPEGLGSMRQFASSMRHFGPSMR